MDLKNCEFINYESIGLDDLKNKIVLLSFFRVGSTPCYNNLRVLSMLENEFADELVVISVHSYTHTNSSVIVKNLVAREKIAHIVINDSDKQLAKSYEVDEFPTLVLIGGGETARFIGDDNYDAIKAKIVEMAKRYEIDRDAIFIPLPNSNDEKILDFPSKIAVSNDKLYISNSGKNDVIIANLDGVITDIIHELDDPKGVAVYKDRVYIANYASNQVIFVDKMIDREPLFSIIKNPTDLSINADQLYCAVAGKAMIIGYDLAKQELYKVAGDLVEPSSVCADDKRVYFADRHSVGFVENGAVTKLAEFDYPQAVALHQNSLIIADSLIGKIYALDLASRAQKVLLEGLNEPTGLATSGDQLFVITIDGLIRHNLATNETSEIELKIIREPNRNYERRDDEI